MAQKGRKLPQNIYYRFSVVPDFEVDRFNFTGTISARVLIDREIERILQYTGKSLDKFDGTLDSMELTEIRRIYKEAAEAEKELTIKTWELTGKDPVKIGYFLLPAFYFYQGNTTGEFVRCALIMADNRKVIIFSPQREALRIYGDNIRDWWNNSN